MATIQMNCTVGIIYRSTLRRALQREGIKFTEDKGWIDSQFVMTGTYEQLNSIRLWFLRLVEQDTNHGS